MLIGSPMYSEKSGFIRGVASLEGNNEVVICGLTRGVVSLEGDNLVVTYYLKASEIWPDKRFGLWWEWP